MGSKWDPLIGKLFGAFPIIAAMALVAFEASISADKIRSVQKGWPLLDEHKHTEIDTNGVLTFLSEERILERATITTDGGRFPIGTSKLKAAHTPDEKEIHTQNQFATRRGELLNGWGTSVLSNGTTVEGEHLDGVPHGVARAVTAKGLVQQGEFVHGVLHGRGSVLGSGWGFADTETTGMWVKGVRHGPGRKYAPYVHSEGNCVNGEQRGEWKYTFKNGRVYTVNHDNPGLLDDFKLFWASFG